MHPRSLALGLCLLAALPACGPDDDRTRRQGGDDLPWVASNGFEHVVAAELGEKLGGCALGDVDRSKPGEEIVAVGLSGKVYVISFDGDTWAHEVAGQAGGEMVQVTLGDVDTNTPELEIVAVGMAEGPEESGGEGAAHVLFRQDDEWVMQEFHRSSALVHAAAVAELDGTPGAEVVLAGFAGVAVVMHLTDDGWQEEIAGPLPGPGKNAVVLETATTVTGVALACADGSVVSLSPSGDAWKLEILDVGPAGAARLDSDGDRLLVARDDGGLGLVPLAGGGRQDIYKEADKLRGAVWANVDPLGPAAEAATAGYSKRITVLNEIDGVWTPRTVFEDEEKIHHLAAGHLPTVGTGVYLVSCGYSGRVVLLRKQL